MVNRNYARSTEFKITTNPCTAYQNCERLRHGQLDMVVSLGTLK